MCSDAITLPDPAALVADAVAQLRADAAEERRAREHAEWQAAMWKTTADAHATVIEEDLRPDIARLRAKAEAYDRINTPEVAHFLTAVENEALHQRERWGVDEDGGKTDADWFWLVGYLAGKALHDVKGKRLHHVITAAAALLNWHAHALGAYARMRPGIADPAALATPTPAAPGARGA